jgi:purine-cytosine permease-like protein
MLHKVTSEVARAFAILILLTTITRLVTDVWSNLIQYIIVTYFPKHKILAYFVAAIFVTAVVVLVAYFGLRELHRLDKIGVLGSTTAVHKST